MSFIYLFVKTSVLAFHPELVQSSFSLKRLLSFPQRWRVTTAVIAYCTMFGCRRHVSSLLCIHGTVERVKHGAVLIRANGARAWRQWSRSHGSCVELYAVEWNWCWVRTLSWPRIHLRWVSSIVKAGFVSSRSTWKRFRWIVSVVVVIFTCCNVLSLIGNQGRNRTLWPVNVPGNKNITISWKNDKWWNTDRKKEPELTVWKQRR